MKVKNTFILTCIVSIVNFIETHNMEGFIVGGELSNIEDFPHSVFLTILCGEKGKSCGASIINQGMLLTAAHCVDTCNSTCLLYAFTGSPVKYLGSKTKVVGIKAHPNYDSFTHANDIALLRLQDNLKFGAKVKRVILMKYPPQYKTAVIAGWGWIDLKGAKGKDLKHVRQEILSYHACSKMISDIPHGTFCGREQTGGSYPEKGDSGSALIAKGSVQIGLVSFKKRSYANETIVYTDLKYFYDWIKKHAEHLICNTGSSEIILENHY